MKHSHRSLLAFAVAVFTASGCGVAAPGAGPRAAGAIAAAGKAGSAAIDDLFSNFAAGKTPGAAVLVLRGGRVVHRKGYGSADLAGGRAVTADTAFDLGGVSMSMTAMGVMVLAEQGKVGYDDPLAKHLPGLAGPVRAVTVRQLLNHTAGLPDYRPLYAEKVAAGGWPAGYAPTGAEILALVAAQPTLDFAPGEDFAVSGSNYVALAQVVEKASGARFAAFMKQRVFQPLGMAKARVVDDSGPADPQAATGYAFQNGRYEPFGASQLHRVSGDGRVAASAADMAKWSRAYTPGALVGQATLKAATTPPELAGGGRSTYGFGLLVKASTAGDPMWLHAGQAPGFRSAIVMRPERGFTAVVLSNDKATAALALADEIMQQQVAR